ncbi:MAG: GDP-perosamine synthase [Phycisphaerae bacterium]|nr:GDP-perosamine synthase [Phycisphaerae bacterium]
MRIPLSRPDINDQDIAAVVEVMRSGQLSLGPKVPEFEKAIADYLGMPYAVAVANGTAALQLALLALELEPGAEVITTPFSFVASANCALMVGAIPVFVDIDPETWNIDVSAIHRALTERTRAVLPVHVFGQPARMDAIQELAFDEGLYIVEDACEAIGATFQHKKVGTFGEISTLAFYPNKQMTTGEGGMLVTAQETIAERVRSLRNQGRDQSSEWLAHARLGYNYRLTDMQCALGLSQMQRLETMLNHRAQVAQWYRQRLREDDRLVLQHIRPDVQMSWFVYVVRLADRYTQTDRDRIILQLKARGIDCNNYFAPLHLMPHYRERFGYRPGDFPRCEHVAARTLALPFHNNLTEAEVDEVCRELRQLL